MANPNFMPSMSTNDIWRDLDQSRCLTDDLDTIESDIVTLETGKADTVHTHDGYALTTHKHSFYADIDHDHNDDYAPINHTHTGYALSSDVTALQTQIGDTSVSEQISAAISTKANANHVHVEYATVSHTHDDYAANTHFHTEYAPVNHIHSYNDLSDLPTIPTTLPANGGNADTVDGKHASDFATASDVLTLQTKVGDTPVSEQISYAVASKANATHAHVITDITELSAELDSKYEKPSTGITKTDLATDVQASLSKADTAVQDLSGYATESYVDTKIADVIDSSPDALNTLNELAAALGDDPNFATTIATQIGSKVDKVDGKGLSSNDYTDSDKTKLLGVEAGANKTIVDSTLSSDSTNPVQNKVVNAAISNLNTLVGDTTVSSQINTAIANKVDVVSGKGLSTNDYTTTEKNKLSGISAGAEVNQNAFSNFAVGSTSIAADTKTDTLTLAAGSNVTLTPDETNNKITISATDTIYNHPTYTAKNAGLYKVTVDGTGHVSGTTVVAKSDITALGIPAQDTTYSAATASSAGLMSASDKAKLDGIATGANKTTIDDALSSSSINPVQNKVVSAAISDLSDLVGDTAVSTQISNAIATKAEVDHTHNYAGSSSAGGAATSANKLNTNAGSATQPVYFANGVPKAVTYTLGKSVPENAVFTDTTYSAATTSTAGLMSAADKTKLNGIATGANAYTLPTASSSTLGGVKTTSTVTSNSGYTACPIISGVPYYKDTNTTYSLSSFGITATAAELNYVDGVTSNIQTQLNGKASSSHTHNYAGSSSAGGAANSAVKLSTARTIRTNLGSTSTASFDGSANVTPGVTGTLPIANGGTGATTVAGVLANLGNIGKVYSSTPSAKSIAKTTLATIASLTLPAGTYIITGNHQWSVDGPNCMCLSRLTKSDDSVVYCITRGDMTGGGGMSSTTIVELTASTTIKYEAYHQYTAAASAEAIRLYAVKIK